MTNASACSDKVEQVISGTSSAFEPYSPSEEAFEPDFVYRAARPEGTKRITSRRYAMSLWETLPAYSYYKA